MQKSIKGHCLIAAPKLRDANFYQTVVILVEHNADGAMGLIVNRPSSVLVSHALAEFGDIGSTEDVVYSGGPVEPTALFVLHAFEKSAEAGEVAPGLYVGNSAENFAEVLRHSISDSGRNAVRVFCGCAGWGPEQLESEIAEGDWLVLPACKELVFLADPYQIYDDMLDAYNAAVLPELCSQSPQSAELN